MDAQLLQWYSTNPADLSLGYGRQERAWLPQASFDRGHTNLSLFNDGRTAAMPDDNSPENLWVCGDQAVTGGIVYWTLRLEVKSSVMRYVGVGVGKDGVVDEYPRVCFVLGDGGGCYAQLSLSLGC